MKAVKFRLSNFEIVKGERLEGDGQVLSRYILYILFIMHMYRGRKMRDWYLLSILVSDGFLGFLLHVLHHGVGQRVAVLVYIHFSVVKIP